MSAITVSSSQALLASKAVKGGSCHLRDQSGYLTIVGEQQHGVRTLYELDYPNLEVRHSLHTALLKNWWIPNPNIMSVELAELHRQDTGL